VQGAAGFGLPIVVMPALINLFGISTASAIVALVATAQAPIFVIRYRRNLNMRRMVPLIVAAYLGIPIGVYLVSRVNSDLVAGALGVILLLYVLYAWFTPQLPELNQPAWAYLFGFFSGILAGAYTIGSVAVIVYATCRRWPMAEFKANLQAYFLIINTFLIVNHAIAGNLTEVVWRSTLVALPVAMLGLFAGFTMDRYLSGPRFRHLVLVLLMMMGLLLIFF
jgi:uncharacterized membrane protein YfcA